MQSIKLHSHVGPDGILKLEVPVGLNDTDLELFLIVQPVIKSDLSTTTEPKTNQSPEELGWPPGFFEQTAGSLADDPIERPPQGEYEVREELV